MIKKSPTPPAAKAAETPQKARPPETKDGLRETIESIVIAFVLAFLFRTFEAEAFVIPTGSMAPTLMGDHKDLVCTECGYPYRVSASESSDESVGKLRSELAAIEDDVERLEKLHADSSLPPFKADDIARELDYKTRQRQQKLDDIRAKDVVAGTCPLCRYTMPIDPDSPAGKRSPTFKGDRILVAKFPYEFSEPERWDVAVFKYPEAAKQNFIKRIVGLPQETLILHHGDVLTMDRRTWEQVSAGLPERQHGFSRQRIESDVLRDLRAEGKLQIQRKPPSKVQAMLQVVYDNDYVLPRLLGLGWPARWQPAGDSPEGWHPVEENRAFAISKPQGEQWIRYRHFVPLPQDWALLDQRSLTGQELERLRPRFITDFYAYNAGRLRSAGSEGDENDVLGMHWVGDLAVECEVAVESQTGQFTLELVEGGRRFQCRFDLATGKARLSISGLEHYSPQADTDLRGPGVHEVAFANVDDQLLLWVDGDLVEFDGDARYENLENHVPQEDDRSPVGIASEGAVLRVNHLRVLRDVYYIAFEKGGQQGSSRVTAFPLAEDQFLVLGDNSPRSKDSRLWSEEEYYVARELLIGKALYIYWPHALNHIPGSDIWFPFFPNFPRMGLVR